MAPASFRKAALAALLVLVAPGCASSGPPRNVDDACAILRDRPGWIDAARAAERKWGAPVPAILAFIWRESRFQPRARPPRTRILGVIPGARASSAYGYSQAIDGTWDWYREDSGNRGADRNDFADSVDFIGWYMDKTRRKTGAPLDDVFAQYVAYYRGHGGYRAGRWRKDAATLRKAQEVADRAEIYARQLTRCDAGAARASRGAAAGLKRL